MRIVQFCEEDTAVWDGFVGQSLTGTFLHTRRFLSYHGERFKDVSVLIKDENDELVGLFPAAIDSSDERRVISHPGITYGGVLHADELRGARMIEAFMELKKHYAAQDFTALQYKAVPHIYHRAPAADDLYAVFIHNAVRYRCDLSCAIDFANRRELSSRRKRSLKKALKSGIRVDEGASFSTALWGVLEENLVRKYEARPVHSLDEIIYLQSLFSEQIKFVVALLGNEVVAGIVLFLTETVAHVQYVASSPMGYETSALDAVFNHCLKEAEANGKRYFDFGTSNEENGRRLNESLYNFKSEFGAGGVAYEFYEMNLQ
jgi:hypothetical protein